MSAFNHRFKALDERHAWRGHSDQDPGRKCSRCKVTTSRPKQTAVILACYDYVTGKAGRVTSSEVNVCRESTRRASPSNTSCNSTPRCWG